MSVSKLLSYYFVNKYEERNIGEWRRLFSGTVYAGFLLGQKYEQNPFSNCNCMNIFLSVKIT